MVVVRGRGSRGTAGGRNGVTSRGVATMGSTTCACGYIAAVHPLEDVWLGGDNKANDATCEVERCGSHAMQVQSNLYHQPTFVQPLSWSTAVSGRLHQVPLRLAHGMLILVLGRFMWWSTIEGRLYAR